jgi:hypothetical protein
MIQEYIRMRNSGQYNIEWFHKYYRSKGGKDVPLQTFHMVFQTANLDQVLERIDKEYNLTSLYDVNNKLIKTWQ